MVPRRAGARRERQPAGSRFGIMIVQMLGADRLRAEAFTGGSLLDAAFTNASRIYVR